ncbi:hypothetical protein LTR39_005298 [Cryomyces antarcticus]|nr:hypothetical protein LTR39_005298 [Cryomyces antarcticus]
MAEDSADADIQKPCLSDRQVQDLDHLQDRAEASEAALVATFVAAFAVAEEASEEASVTEEDLEIEEVSEAAIEVGMAAAAEASATSPTASHQRVHLRDPEEEEAASEGLPVGTVAALHMVTAPRLPMAVGMVVTEVAARLMIDLPTAAAEVALAETVVQVAATANRDRDRDGGYGGGRDDYSSSKRRYEGDGSEDPRSKRRY